MSRPKARGDAAQAFADAPLKVAGDYKLAPEHHNPMEMFGSTVEWHGDGAITVHDKTQGSQGVQAYLASIFGFSKSKVRVLNPYVGGGFGSGLRPQHQVFLAVLAAKMLERSVRVTMTRQQMFSHAYRPQAIQSHCTGRRDHRQAGVDPQRGDHLHLALRGQYGECRHLGTDELRLPQRRRRLHRWRRLTPPPRPTCARQERRPA